MKTRGSLVAGLIVLLLALYSSSSAGQDSLDAALNGDLETVKSLVAGDPGIVNQSNDNGKTMLHYAAQGGHVELVEFLVGSGADVNSHNIAGETPLHYATAMGHVEVVRVLLARGATCDAVEQSGHTPLHYVAFSGNVEIARLLVARDAHINAANEYGYKPLDLAYRNQQSELSAFLETLGGTRIAVEDPVVELLSGSVHRIRFPFGDDSNIAASVGGDGYLLVDTGFSERALKKLGKTLATLGEGDVKVIVNTHLHPDHIAGNNIAAADTAIIDATNLDDMVSKEVLKMGAEPLKGKSGLSFGSYYTMMFNGEEVRLIPYGGIHTENDLLVHFTRSHVVHMGDLLILQSFPSVRRKTEDYLALLEKVVDYFPAPTRFVCGHGKGGSVADVKAYRRDLLSVAEIITEGLGAGRSKQAILEDEALRPYDDWSEMIPELGTEYWYNAVAADVEDGTGQLY